MAELADLIGELHAQLLDRQRPLWDAWVVQGLGDGRLVVVVKVSHAMADGVGAVTSLLPELMTVDPGAQFAATPQRARATDAGRGSQGVGCDRRGRRQHRGGPSSHCQVGSRRGEVGVGNRGGFGTPHTHRHQPAPRRHCEARAGRGCATNAAERCAHRAPQRGVRGGAVGRSACDLGGVQRDHQRCFPSPRQPLRCADGWKPMRGCRFRHYVP